MYSLMIRFKKCLTTISYILVSFQFMFSLETLRSPMQCGLIVDVCWSRPVCCCGMLLHSFFCFLSHNRVGIDANKKYLGQGNVRKGSQLTSCVSGC